MGSVRPQTNSRGLAAQTVERNNHRLRFLRGGSGWCHLHNDDPAQMLSGTAPRLYHDPATAQWKLVIEATMFVTNETVVVWSGVKPGGNDPTGTFTHVSGCDPTATLTVEAA